MFHIIKLILLVLLTTGSQNAIANATCWSIGGYQDDNWLVCDPDAEVSGCCVAGNTCYSNGLCGARPEDYPNQTLFTPFYLNGCTDSSFDDPACAPARECSERGGQYIILDRQVVVLADSVHSAPGVGVVTCGAGKYCCYGVDGCGIGCPTDTPCDCTSFDGVFSLGLGSIVTSLPAASYYASSTSTSVQKPMSSSPNTETAASTTTSTGQPTPTPDPSSDTTALGVGVGVGVGGALVIVALGFALWFVKRRRRLNQDTDPKYEDLSNAYPKYGAEAPSHERRTELGARDPGELNGESRPLQLDSDPKGRQTHELSGRQ